MAIHIFPQLDAPYDTYVKQLQLPLWEKTCLFEAGVGKNINGNMFALIKTICQDTFYQDYQLALAIVPDLLDAARKRLDDYGLGRVQLVIVESAKYNELLARAKYLFNDNTFPAYFSKRPDQIYLNTWHGTPLKRLGLSDIANSLRSFANVQKNLLTATYDLFPNPHTRNAFVTDYDLAAFYSGSYLMHDYPRNDVFSDTQVYAQIRAEQGIPDTVEVIAYMPTWRGAGRTANSEQQRAALSQYLGELDAQLSNQQLLFVNLHFTVEGTLDFSAYQHIHPFPSQLESYDFLAACDKLITDYSSVMFDFAITRRPIYLFAYDEQEYMTDKGSYFPYRSLPFPLAHTSEELCVLLGATYKAPGYDEFIKKFCPYHTGSASKDLVAYIFGNNRKHVTQELQQTPAIDWAYYVFHLGKKTLDSNMVQTILDKAAAHQANERAVLITTGTYNQKTIEAFEQLRGHIPLLVIVRRHVQTQREQLLLKLSGKHKILEQLLAPRLQNYFVREARQLLSGICPKNFVALAPDSSYLMWMIKALKCRRFIAAPLKLADLPRRVRICLGTSYKEQSEQS